MKAAKAASSFFLPRMNDGASKRIGGSGEDILGLATEADTIEVRL
jgi:hypothetical protein